MQSQSDRDPGHGPRATSAGVRRRALQHASARTESSGMGRRVQAGEKRRYLFQVWTSAGFAAAWVVVFVLSGSWLFLALAAGFALLGAGAAWCLVVLSRRPPSG